jgi:arabinose-5-phosphate isomerase
MKLRKFSAQDFAIYHPAGQLGRQLIRVGEAMTFKAGENLALASDSLTVGEALKQVSTIKRRSGAIVLIDKAGKLSGIFTDGDLRRLLTSDPTHATSRPMREAMGKNPMHISHSALASEAMAIMQKHRIDELPVVNGNHEPVGMIDIQDLVVLRMLDVEPESTDPR